MALLYIRNFPTPPIALSSLPLEDVFIALSMHAGYGYSSPFGGQTGPTACLPPGYPVIIYLVTRLVGVGTAAVLAMLFLQIAFSSLTVFVVMYVAKRDFGIRVSNIAGVLCACSIPLLLAPIWLWETSLSTLILISFLCLSPQRRWSARFCLLMGFGCGIASLINPALLPALVLICAWELRHARAKVWYLLLGIVLVVSPWLVRNYTALHAVVPVRDSFGLELWLGNHAPDATGLVPKSSPSEMAAFRKLGEIQYMRVRGAEARHYIEEHPAIFLRHTAHRMTEFWIGSFSGAFGIMFAVMGAAGLILFRRQSERWLLYATPIILFPLPYYITHSGERYRYVLDPILVILSANCLSWLLGVVQSKPSAERLSVSKTEAS